jgi:hypothetical protein
VGLYDAKNGVFFPSTTTMAKRGVGSGERGVGSGEWGANHADEGRIVGRGRSGRI